jgi:hypothetical protein
VTVIFVDAILHHHLRILCSGRGAQPERETLAAPLVRFHETA